MFNLTFGHLSLIAYVLGAGYFGMQLIIRLLNLKRIIQQSKRSIYDEQKALIHPTMPVSSFFSYLFWKKEKEQFDYLLVEHEKVHMRQWHSLDILVMEVAGVIMWFNPLVKYIANDLRLLHEFIADDAVVNKFGQKSTYTQLLCKQTLVPAPLFTHNFHSFIKNRLHMLGGR